MPEARRISSHFTLFLKFVFAPVLMLAFGAGIVLTWWDPQGLIAASPGGSSGNWSSTAVFVVALVSLYWAGLSLKRVTLTDEGLEVSNYFRTERIPFSAISGVSQLTYLHPRIVTVGFKARTRFGRRIRYLPTARWASSPFALGVEDVEVTTIRRRLEPART